MALEDEVAQLTVEVGNLVTVATGIVARTQGAADLADAATASISAAASAVHDDKVAADTSSASAVAAAAGVHNDAVAASTASAASNASANNSAAFATAAAQAQAQAQTIANNSAASATAAAAAQAATQTIANSAAATAALAASTSSDITAAAAAVASDKTAVHNDRIAADADAAATAADRVAVASDKTAVHNDRVAADTDAAATAADRVAVASDKAATYTDRVAADSAATAAAASAATASGEADAATAQALIATTQAGNAAGSATTATTQASIAATQAGVATAQAGTATTKASDASTFAAAALGSYNNANALLSSASAYAIIAQQAAATVSAQTGLSILGAAQRAVALMTDGAATFIYDTRRDSDGGAWVDKCVSQSIILEALNTATRGSTAKYPKMMLLVGRNAAVGNPSFVIYDLTDPTVPMWAVWNGTNNNPVGPGVTYAIGGISALNGRIWIAQAGGWGLSEIDLISELMTVRNSASGYSWPNGLASRNAGTSTNYVTGGQTSIASATVNSIAATIAPNTPLNPLRCNLPNPTVFAFTNGGVSTLRWDGVVVNSASTSAYSSGCVDNFGNVWMINSSDKNIYVASGSSVLAANWATNSLALFTWPQIGIGTMVKISAIGNGMVAIAGVTGLARIKLDPANPAQSLINVKTTTYDTGWMVLGKTVLALAESSQGLSTLTAAQVVTNSTFATDLSGWTNADAGAGYASAWNSGGGMVLPRDGTAANYGRRHQMLTLPANAGGVVSVTCTGGEVNCYVGSVALTNDVLSLPTSGGTAKKSFNVPASGVVYITLLAAANGTSPVVTSITCDVAAADRSGSGNGPKVIGAPTRAVVASGADTAALGGFATDAYLRLSHVSALDQGANDFAVMCPITFPASGSYSTICHYTDEAGAAYGTSAFWCFRVEYTGTLVAIFYDGTTTQAVTSTATVPTSGVHIVAFARRGQYGEIYMDGVRIARASLSTLASLSNGNANLLIGATCYGGAMTYPAVGKLGKLRLFNYAPTPDQFAFMMADEAPTNVANAQSLLTGANVQGVAWDPDTEQLAAPNSTAGCDVFKGSVRVANDNSATRSTNKALSLSGFKVGDNFGAATAGIQPVVVGAGYVNGSRYIDVQYSGTPSGSNNIAYYFNGWLLTPAAVGQAWVAGLTTHLVAGSMANVAGFTMAIYEFSAGGAYLAGVPQNLSATGVPVRSTQNRTLSNGSVAFAQLYFTFSVTSGQAINATIRYTMPNLQNAASETFMEPLSNSANAKAAAFAGGKLAVVTAAGVDVWIPAADGLRAINDAVGSPKRPFYDPTWGQYFGVTTDATPTVFASIPIPEGKAFRFRATVVAVMYGGTATEKAVYDITGVVSRDIGGNVVVVSTTTTISEVTSSMDCIAQANTTAQTLEIKATGKAATRIAWLAGLELYDLGLMAAA